MQMNVVLIMTDDQGYSDVGFNGNPIVQTPHLDNLAKQSIRFSQFYAQPVCSPTRAALMTGLHALRTGVIDTQSGVSILHPKYTTLAEALKANGYKTGMFGKWHLGDNLPSRPQDQGFNEVLTHIGGMIGAPYSLRDHQSYFEPLLIHNGEDKLVSGYAPDIFTDAALTFIKNNAGVPTFTFLSFNTPHHPLTSPDAYSAPYREKGLSEDTARYYGMISNIDWNVGRLIRTLAEKNLLENTIIIFLGDNGTSSLHTQNDLWEYGLKGRKTFVYENGIRVPLLMKIPALPSSTIDEVAIVEDIMPTVLSFLDLEATVDFDGMNLKPFIIKQRSFPERAVHFQFHRGEEAQMFRNAATRKGDFKLIQPTGRGTQPFEQDTLSFELYNVAKDPFEKENLALQYPEIVEELKLAHMQWFKATKKEKFEPTATWIGSDLQNPVLLTRQDWQGGGLHDGETGIYNLKVKQSGTYRFIFHWSELLDGPHDVQIWLNDKKYTRTILRSESSARIESIYLNSGALKLNAWVEISGQAKGFRFIEIERIHPTKEFIK
jgi:arylsulfatase A-like enzyme